MNGLVKAAKAEGELNVITLPANWANYGNIMKAFTAKYGIKINDANPDGSSQDEINAMEQLKGQSRAPDVLDMGTAFAIQTDQKGLLAPYKVATWSNIPADSKASDATWYDDYGGFVAIGYNPAKVKVAPTSFKDLSRCAPGSAGPAPRCRPLPRRTASPARLPRAALGSPWSRTGPRSAGRAAPASRGS
jgi:putative spermidine/putrescine transport system substrate-binding protein